MSTGRLTDVVLRKAWTMSRRFLAGFVLSLADPGAFPPPDVSRETSGDGVFESSGSCPVETPASFAEAVEENEAAEASTFRDALSPETSASIRVEATVSAVAVPSLPAVFLLEELTR